MKADTTSPLADSQPLKKSVISDEPGVWSKHVRALTWHGGELKKDRVKIVTESPLTILLNQEEVVTLLCIRDAPCFLAVGFLFSEGLLQKVEDIQLVEDDPEEERVIVLADNVQRPSQSMQKRIITTGCGKGTTFKYGLDEISARSFSSQPRVTPDILFGLMRELVSMSQLYKETHGTHNSGLASPAGLEVFHADVGRHNAVDKIYGQCLLESRSTQDKIMVTTGRLTSEIVIKCARMGIPMLVSRHAATTMAVELARQLNMTLVGYLRGSKLTVYSGFDRVQR
jgi:FdhD protein